MVSGICVSVRALRVFTRRGSTVYHMLAGCMVTSPKRQDLIPSGKALVCLGASQGTLQSSRHVIYGARPSVISTLPPVMPAEHLAPLEKKSSSIVH